MKRATPRKLKTIHRLQRVVAAIFPIRLLRFTVNTEGQASLDREVVIMDRLRARGARVPELAARGAGWIALTDLGLTLEDQLRTAANRSEAMALGTAGAEALLILHRRNGWHGNPQARNLAGRPDQIGFIDFEEDVGACLGRDASQIRDWLLFLSSLYCTEKRFPGLLASLVTDIGGGLPLPIRAKSSSAFASSPVPSPYCAPSPIVWGRTSAAASPSGKPSAIFHRSVISASAGSSGSPSASPPLAGLHILARFARSNP